MIHKLLFSWKISNIYNSRILEPVFNTFCCLCFRRFFFFLSLRPFPNSLKLQYSKLSYTLVLHKNLVKICKDTRNRLKFHKNSWKKSPQKLNFLAIFNHFQHVPTLNLVATFLTESFWPSSHFYSKICEHLGFLGLL